MPLLPILVLLLAPVPSMGLAGPVPTVGVAPPGRTAGAVCGIFVAKTGLNLPDCGLTKESPCLTVQQGINRAFDEGASCVFVQAGVYTQTITLVAGVSVIGGFDTNWISGPYTQANHASEIRGVANQVDDQSMAVAARALTPAVLLENLILTAPNASGFMTGTISGKSSYVIHASGSNLVVRNCKLVAGNGVPGGTGASGTNAPSISRTAAMNGEAGGNGNTYLANCNDSSRGAGGLRGVNVACASANGGVGGAGGTGDTECSGINNYQNTPGLAGTDAATTFILFGTKGGGGAVCSSGQPGLQGRVSNGARGNRGTGGLSVVQGAPQYFIGAPSSAGGVGLFGGGGGGGGGEGGCDTGLDRYGAGGGGGGAGGCAALAAGGGGGAGGASLGVALFGSHVEVSGCDFVLGQGGSGGTGGFGGRGQQGGLAGQGGDGAGLPGGGAGGFGGHGGHGGGGGGGSGGACIAIARCSNSTATLSSSTFDAPTPGAGGAGGISAPGVEAEIDDGNDGEGGSNGLAGQSLSVATCATAPEPSLAITPCDIATCLLVDAPGDGAVAALSFRGLTPNPTTAGGRFQFAVPRPGRVRLVLYDHAGRRLRTLVDSSREAGARSLAWDGRDDAGRKLASGVYLARLEFEGEQRVERVIVAR